MKRTIIFSAVNVTQGGPLTLLRNFMEFAEATLAENYDVWFFVYTKEVVGREFFRIKIREFPNSRSTVFHKLFYEYVHFKKISKDIRPAVWFSLNDCSPSVCADMRVVYIHNATALYSFSWLDFRFPSRIVLQRFYYWFFLKANLNMNSFVIVQQRFMKDFVVRKLRFRRPENILLHRPVFSFEPPVPSAREKGIPLMIYPTKPEVYKNVHLLIKGLKILKDKYGLLFGARLTLTGRENRYSRFLVKLGRDIPEIAWTGTVPHNILMEQIASVDILVFPSKLETWGLPLSEAKQLDKYVVAADLPYARETLDGYPLAEFFDPDSAEDLAAKLARAIEHVKTRQTRPDSGKQQQPDENSLKNIFEKILGGVA